MSADGGLRRRLALQLIPFLDGRERGSAFDGSWMRSPPGPARGPRFPPATPISALGNRGFYLLALCVVISAYRLAKAALASSSVSAIPLFGGGAGSECRNQRHFITPW